MIPTLVLPWSKIWMCCISITWHYIEHLLVIYDTQYGITIEDALSRYGPSLYTIIL
jgi:hypothetical protein